MSNPVKVTFAKEFYLKSLTADPNFIDQFSYLTPSELSDKTVLFNDPNENHISLDSEEVILTNIANFLKGIKITTFVGETEFLTPIQGKQKRGFAIGGNVIVSSTDI